MTKLRCLIIDDEADARRIFREAVLAACQDMEIEEAGTPGEAEDAIRSGKYAIALVDCNLKGATTGNFEGLGFARDLSASGCDVIMISGMPQRELATLADDVAKAAFMQKPVNHAELVVAVTRTLRNREERPPRRSELPPGLEIDPHNMRIMLWKERRVVLSTTLYNLVQCLARNHGKLVLHEDLLKCLTSGHMADLHSQIRRVKAAFRGVDKEFSAIESMSGHGYIWTS
ncbi:MAG: response regulator [Devosia sp.]|nr:response regulator [Devosia sp.]